mmetsp:Transcript_10944/g.33560  ORF Transcript_10944/g.33560 Transcript_10944/m.33560 type:complete len:134 (+) Transcript_10944:457-858(+)
MKTSRKEYRCEVHGCGQMFTRRFNLRSHMRKHTGDKPYACSVESCGAKFRWRSSFVCHIKWHEKVLSSLRRSSVGGHRIHIDSLIDLVPRHCASEDESFKTILKVINSCNAASLPEERILSVGRVESGKNISI